MSTPNWTELGSPIDASAMATTPSAQVAGEFDLATSDALNWMGVGGSKSATGIRITEQVAETFAAVWAATRALSGTLASLPARLHANVNGVRTLADDVRLSRLLTQQPNESMDAFTFYELMMKRLVNQGNAFAVIERDKRDRIVALMPVHNSRVRAYRPPSDRFGHRGELEYQIFYDDTDLTGPDPKGGHFDPIPARNMLNIVGPMSNDGILAPGVIGRATESIGMGIATERFGASFFGNDARPSGVLEHPADLDDAARANIRREWNNAHAGPNNWHNIAVLWEDMKYRQIGVAPEQAQFLGTRQFNIQVISQWYGVAPAVLQDYKDSKFQSVEAQIRHFQFALREWAERIERAIKNQILDGTPYELEFSMRSLLRGDPKAQAETNQIRLQNGALQLDEWRAEDGLNPMENTDHGSTHFMMGNLFTVDRVVTGEAVPSRANGQGHPSKSSKANQDVKYAQRVFDLAASRMVQVERNAAVKASSKANFVGWLDRFVEEFAPTVASAIEIGVEGLLPDRDRKLIAMVADGIAREHLADVKASLLSACECPAEQLAERVASAFEDLRIEFKPTEETENA